LVVEHPDFDLVRLGNNSFELRTLEGSISLVENFPKKSKRWYEFDERFRIPVGSPKRKHDSMRRLWRDYSCVGPVARYFVDYCNDRLGVGLDCRPSNGLGVAVF
jgi:hypothetical protein